MATSDVPIWRVLLGIVLTAGSSVGLTIFADRIYARSVLRTGFRVALAGGSSCSPDALAVARELRAVWPGEQRSPVPRLYQSELTQFGLKRSAAFCDGRTQEPMGCDNSGGLDREL
jgi:hypothetical protein